MTLRPPLPVTVGSPSHCQTFVVFYCVFLFFFFFAQQVLCGLHMFFYYILNTRNSFLRFPYWLESHSGKIPDEWSVNDLSLLAMANSHEHVSVFPQLLTKCPEFWNNSSLRQQLFIELKTQSSLECLPQKYFRLAEKDHLRQDATRVCGIHVFYVVVVGTVILGMHISLCADSLYSVKEKINCLHSKMNLLASLWQCQFLSLSPSLSLSIYLHPLPNRSSLCDWRQAECCTTGSVKLSGIIARHCGPACWSSSSNLLVGLLINSNR